MDPTTKDKLVVNVANSWKMLSVQFITGVTGVFLSIIGYVAKLPEDQQIALATTLLNHLGYVSLIPVAILAIHYYARVKPQAGITPEVAAAKNLDTPQAAIDPDHEAMNVPLVTKPGPLPPIDGDPKA